MRIVDCLWLRGCRASCSPTGVLLIPLLVYRPVPCFPASPSLYSFGLSAAKPKEPRSQKTQIREFFVGQGVMARNMRPGPDWVSAIIVERLGPVSYLMETSDHQFWKRHVDQFRGIPTVPQASSDSDNADDDIDLPVTGQAPVLDKGPVSVDPPVQVEPPDPPATGSAPGAGSVPTFPLPPSARKSCPLRNRPLITYSK